MLLEASLVCRDNGVFDAEEGSIHIHVDPSEIAADYRMDATDARLLSSLGISPSRHRSRPSRRRVNVDDKPDR
jgi:hypothetical protein